MENKPEKKVIKISAGQFLSIAASFVIVAFLGGNFYAQAIGKPNIYTAMKNINNSNYAEKEQEKTINIDEIAKELFEKGANKIKELKYSSLEYDIANPRKEKHEGYYVYYKTTTAPSMPT